MPFAGNAVNDCSKAKGLCACDLKVCLVNWIFTFINLDYISVKKNKFIILKDVCNFITACKAIRLKFGM